MKSAATAELRQQRDADDATMMRELAMMMMNSCATPPRCRERASDRRYAMTAGDDITRFISLSAASRCRAGMPASERR